MEDNEALTASVVRTFVVSDVRCSICNTNEHAYALFARNRTTNEVSETFLCTRCDLGEDA